MLIAEIRHKVLNLDLLDPSTTICQIRDSFHEFREDLLTADVFGAMKYLPRSIGLGPFIRAIAKAAPQGSPFHNVATSLCPALSVARFKFWPVLPTPSSMAGIYTEPDVIIEFPEHVVVVEAKYRSGLGVEQLERELLAGLRAYAPKAVFVVLVTSGTSAPRLSYDGMRMQPTEYLRARSADEKLPTADAVELSNNADHVLWISWRGIRLAIESACEEITGDPSVDHLVRARELVADLATLLDMRKIRSFHAVSSLVSKHRAIPAELGLQLPRMQQAFTSVAELLSAAMNLDYQDECLWAIERRLRRYAGMTNIPLPFPLDGERLWAWTGVLGPRDQTVNIADIVGLLKMDNDAANILLWRLHGVSSRRFTLDPIRPLPFTWQITTDRNRKRGPRFNMVERIGSLPTPQSIPRLIPGARR